MRLAEVARGDTVGNRALIGFISLVSGMRLPDAARVAFYDRAFLAGALGDWSQTAMRGPSEWSVSERELMAAMVATWNSTPFCMGAHRATSAKAMTKPVVDAAMSNYRTAELTPKLKAVLTFLEKMTRTPDALTGADAGAALKAGVSEAALRDAIAVCTLFNIVTRYADALDFAMPTELEFDKAADILLKRGYGG
jgi:uncharacterized peroxidase-related enzyme